NAVEKNDDCKQVQLPGSLPTPHGQMAQVQLRSCPPHLYITTDSTSTFSTEPSYFETRPAEKASHAYFLDVLLGCQLVWEDASRDRVERRTDEIRGMLMPSVLIIEDDEDG